MAMPSSSSLILVGALAGAALFALLRKEPSQTASHFEPRSAPTGALDPPMERAEDDVLPPNHPPIGGQDPTSEPNPPEDGPLALSWKAPTGWTKVQSPNAMRLATYRVPAAAGARDEAELTVVRAGGSTEANLERWTGQFENPEGIVRDKRVVHGLTVSTLEVRGTFRGGGMATTGPAESKTGWMLKGAVVETADGPFFFKLTGPTASVVAARAGFDALMNSVAPASKPAAE